MARWERVGCPFYIQPAQTPSNFFRPHTCGIIRRMRICEICRDRPAEKTGNQGRYARKCYRCRKAFPGRRTLRERFEARVECSEGCWGWNGAKDRYGYPVIGVATSRQNLAHRVSYELYIGPIPRGAFVCHRCDNPECTNPNHLFLGDHAANMRDMSEKGRSAHGEKNANSKLSTKDVLEIRESGGSCRGVAAEYGVSYWTVAAIRRREVWKNL